jgi:hypothetical protein
VANIIATGFPDGRYLATVLFDDGSDLDLPLVVARGTGSVASWAPDRGGFLTDIGTVATATVNRVSSAPSSATC